MESNRLRNIFLGTGAAWLSVFIGLLSQLLLVPLYLSYWTASQYGAWLVLLASVGYLSLVNVSFQTYMQGEFFKVGRSAQKRMVNIFWQAVYTSLILSAVELVIVVCLVCITNTSFFEINLDNDFTSKTFSFLLVGYAILNLFFMPFGGTAVKVLTAYGQFARVTMWGVLRQFLSVIMPAISLIYTTSLLNVGIVWLLAHSLCALLSHVDLVYQVRKYGLLKVESKRLNLLFRELLYSSVILLREFLSSLRHRGIRLIMTFFFGPAAVAIFSTNRTLANVLHQGLTALAHPVIPEMMDAIKKRDTLLLSRLTLVIWAGLLTIVCPGFLLLSHLSEPLFEAWTRGKVEFDQILFGYFAVSVMVYLCFQPYYAILTGQNVLRPQIIATFFSSLVLILTMLLMIPRFGLAGAAMSLIAAESVSGLIYLFSVRSWGLAVQLDTNLVLKSIWPILIAVMLTSLLMFLTIGTPITQKIYSVLLLIPLNLSIIGWAGNKMNFNIYKYGLNRLRIIMATSKV